MCVVNEEGADPLGSPQSDDGTSVFLLLLTGPSPLPFHRRRHFCLQVNEAWPLIDHVWSCKTLLISVYSSLVCSVLLFSSEHSSLVAWCVSCTPLRLQHRQSHMLQPPPSVILRFSVSHKVSHSGSSLYSFLSAVSLPPIRLSGSCLGSDSPTPAGAVGMQQLS